MEMLNNRIIRVRKFNENDIPLKVRWINDTKINKYLHYTLPLEEKKTLEWYKKNQNNENRIDNTIELFDGNKYNPIGLIGLLDIDKINKKAEFYICIGEQSAQGRGVAKEVSIEFVKDCFINLDLNKIYLYTEKENISAQKLFEKVGFKQEGLLKEDLIYNGRIVDRYVYGLLRKDFKYEL